MIKTYKVIVLALILLLGTNNLASFGYAQKNSQQTQQKILRSYFQKIIKARNSELYEELDKIYNEQGIEKTIDEAYNIVIMEKSDIDKAFIANVYFANKIEKLKKEKDLNPEHYYAAGIFANHYANMLVSAPNNHKVENKFIADKTGYAALTNFLLWYTITKEDVARCKFPEEAQKNLKERFSKIDGLVSTIKAQPEEKRRKFYNILFKKTEATKSRNPNPAPCKMSAEYQRKLAKTGKEFMMSEQEDGKILLHIEKEKTNETTKTIGYFNTEGITPEYISQAKWLEKRKEIHKEIKQLLMDKP